MFDIDNIDLIFTDAAITEIAREAIVRKMGARGLRSIVEKKLTDLMFNAPSMEKVDSVIIDEKFIKGEKEAIIEFSSLASKKKKFGSFKTNLIENTIPAKKRIVK